MRILVLYNPIAGAGKAQASARHLVDALQNDGHEVHLVATRLEPLDGWFDPLLEQMELLVVVGGDGAIRMASRSAARSRTPLYHFPLGTENLFAREFGHDRSMKHLRSAIARHEVTCVDVATVNDLPFVLMTSIGLDANVVHELACRRNGSISHLSYLKPIVRQLLQWRAPLLTVEVDGQRLVDEKEGCLVIANCQQYALQVNPAHGACMTDGEVDVVFFPTRSSLQMLGWAVTSRRRRVRSHPSITCGKGRVVHVRCEPAQFFQLDGDALGQPWICTDADAVSELMVNVEPASLPVLVGGASG